MAMTGFSSFFLALGPSWSWLLLGAMLLGLEIALPGVHFVWFGFSACIVAMIVYAIGITWGWQLTIFALTAATFVLLVRGFASPLRLKTDEPDLNARGQQYVGRIATVEDAIAGGRGKVRIGDSLWTANGPDLPAGAAVKVTGVEGIVLVVVPA
jgi:inner membrane protein